LSEEQFQAFEKALEKLSDQQRQAVLMRLELELDYDVIAAECGYPSANAARMGIARTLGRIGKEMSHGGFGP
jgi:DNA-directed RNA polymerase specialized sigma24 family protein